MLRRLLLIPGFLFFFTVSLIAQPAISRVEPPNWWVNLSDEQLEIMVYGKEIGHANVSLDYPGVRLVSQTRLDSPNYLFLTVEFSEDVSAGHLPIVFTDGKGSATINYPLLERVSQAGQQGFDASDVIYLMMPDRFANGDPSNDTIDGMLEAADRSNPRARHGGDFVGVQQRLDYLQDLGVTAIWFTPVFENDMPDSYRAYHGYAATDMYKVDRRFGTNEEFRELVVASHARGMKVIMDMIHNHVGDHHWWMDDLPASDWLNPLEKYGTTNYRVEVSSDPNASEADMDRMTKGWFVPEMPDLNQENPWLARYLIQNTLWWIEYAGIDGIRMDTYPYPDKHYMADWVNEVLEVFPNFNVVGETWVHSPAVNAYWQRNAMNRDGYESKLPTVTDFQIHNTLIRALNEEFGWSTGVSAIYQTLGQDFLYSDPLNNVVFLDNHDLDRYLGIVGQDLNKFKMAFGFLMTVRGIPQVYYGTEIGMSGLKIPSDANVRLDFPGGWPDDDRDAFTREGRTDLENEIFDYTRKLMRWRKDAGVIHTGKTTHFIPEDAVYVYFRYTELETVMVLMNGSDAQRSPDLKRFSERTDGFRTWKNVETGQTGSLSTALNLPAWSITILELQR